MIRKLILALGATAVLGAAALSPTTASAWGHGHWGHHWHGYGFGYFGPSYVSGPDCYRTKVLVDTPVSQRWRRVTVCN